MWSLAWRNLWRHKSRNLLTAAAVAFVVMSTLVYFGLGEAMKNGMFQLLTETSGHLSVRVKDWREVREFDRSLIRDAGVLEARIRNAAPQAALRAVLEVPALLAGESRSRGVQLIGVRGSTEHLEEHLVAGRLPEPGALEEIALGRALAEALKVGLGDPVYAFAPGTEGLGAAAYTVVGLLDFPESAVEGRVAYTSLEAAQELAAPGAVTRFELHLPGLTKLNQEPEVFRLQERLAAELGPSLAVENWREANPELATYLELTDPLLLIYSAIFFILAAMLVVNTIYLGLVERIREFGVIIAVGANRWQVMRMVILESLALVGTGSLVGSLVGLGLVALMSRGFSFPGGIAEIYAEFGIPTVMYASITPTQVLATLMLAFITALFAAAWPAWVAGRLEPVEAMRFTA